jgi:putative alpha-1,2-mannosidase
VFTWGNSTTTVRSKVGISFISEEKACKFKDEEIKSWSIEETVDAAVTEWNRDVFSKIQIDTGEGANKDHLAMLYTSLYLMHLIPSDRTGENPLWESEEPYWDDFYTLCESVSGLLQALLTMSRGYVSEHHQSFSSDPA